MAQVHIEGAPQSTISFDNYHRCCCVACYCCDCSIRTCFGCKSFGQQCCIRSESVLCKYSEGPDGSFICYQSDFDCSKSICSYSSFSQCCCCYCIVDYCCNPQSVHQQVGITVKKTGAGDLPGDDKLTVCNGACCAISTIYCNSTVCVCEPCFRSAATAQVCCMQGSSVSKCLLCLGDEEKDKSKTSQCCYASKGGFYMIPCECVLKYRAQQCCFDDRCAMPCTPDVPCVYTPIPFCVLFKSWGFKFMCCPKMNKLLES